MGAKIRPLCKDTVLISFQSEVRPELEEIFRRGASWDMGFEHILLYQVNFHTTARDQT